MIAEIRKALPTLTSDAQAIAVIASAEDLWEQLAYLGVCDEPGSAEWRRDV